MKKILASLSILLLTVSLLLPADVVLALQDANPAEPTLIAPIPAGGIPDDTTQEPGSTTSADETESTTTFVPEETSATTAPQESATTPDGTTAQPETPAPTDPSDAIEIIPPASESSEDTATSSTTPASETSPSDITQPTASTQPDEPEQPSAPEQPPEPEQPSEPEQPTPPPAIKLNVSSMQCGVGEAFSLFSTGEDDKRVSVNYTVSNPLVLQQTQPGQFTAVSAGSALVTAQSAAGATATCLVTVLHAPQEILLKQSAYTLGIGEKLTVQASLPAGSYTRALQYQSDNPRVLRPVSGATFAAKHSGTATITVTAHNGVSASCKITVKKAPKSLSFQESALTIGVDESVQLHPVFPENTCSSSLVYASSTKKVQISAKGKVTGLKKGSAVVTVTAHNGVCATCEITVKKAPKSIKMESTLQMNPGDSYTFQPVIKKGYASHKLTLRSAKKKIVSVTDSLTITANKRGTTTVTLTAFNGVSATCEVQVLKLPSRIKFEQSYFETRIGRKFTPQIVLPENRYCSHYTFTSSDPYVASVDENGLVWCRSIGTAKIQAETPNGKTAVCTVSVSSMAVPAVSQLPSYPTGCEAASCAALLQYYGYRVSVSQMVAAIPRENIVYKNGRRYGPSINKKFVGNPAGSYTSGTPGYGAFSPVIKKALQKVINDYDGSHKAKRITGCTFEELLEQISNGRPAIVWSTYNMLVPQSVNSWYIPQPDGTAKYFQYPRGTHVCVLKGYSRNYVTLMDPYGGSTKTFNRNTFEARWNLLGKQAVVLV